MSNPKRLHANLQDLLAHTKRNEITNCLEWQRTRHKADGYGKYWVNGKNLSTHRLVAQLVIPNPDNKPCVMHLCDNPPCINPDHLQWGTWKDNNSDRQAKGRTIIPNNAGSRHGMSKITEAIADEIRNYDRSQFTMKQVANHYGISESLVSAIKLGKRWKLSD